MAKYNGHESYAAWNVSLWIGNDEGLYRLAKSCIRRGRTLARGAELLFAELEGSSTPDGVRYSKHTVRLALSGL